MNKTVRCAYILCGRDAEYDALILSKDKDESIFCHLCERCVNGYKSLGTNIEVRKQ